MPPTAHSQPHDPPEAVPAGDRRPRFFSPPLVAAVWTVAAALALGAGAIPWLASDPGWLARLVARATPRLDADVSIGEARVGWSGPIVIEHVEFVPRNGATRPVAIRRIEASHGLLGILLSGGDLGRVRVEGLEADVVFSADRTSNLASLVKPAAAGAAADRESGPRRSPLRMRLEIDDAVARVSGPWAAEPWTSAPTDIRAALGPLADGGSGWTVERVQLLRDAILEANVAQGVLAYIAPVMADATRTSGRFSLRLDSATFPLGAPEAARLSGVLSMHQVDVGPGPMVTKALDSLPGRLELPRSIRVADDSEVEFHLASRRVWHKGLEFGIPLAQPGQRLDIHSSGSVGLDDKSLDLKFELPIPADLPSDRPLLAALAGKSISLGIGGVLGEPKVNFDGSIRATAGDVVADLVDRLRGPAAAGAPPAQSSPPPAADRPPAGGRPDAPAPRPPAADVIANPSADAIIDLVGGVLDEVAKRRAERAAANAENPEGTPPVPPRRGGRLLRRLAPPPAEAPSPADQPAAPASP